jgi:hypothetical protein
MQGLEAHKKGTLMGDWMRKDWMRYNSPLRDSDPIGSHKFAFRGGRGRNHTQGRFGQRHAKQTTTDRLTEGSVQHGMQ